MSHKKLIDAGFVKVGKGQKQKIPKPPFNNSQETRFKNSNKIMLNTKVGPGKYSDYASDWNKKNIQY